MKITMICAECGKKPEPDKEKSSENWNVFSTECPCGGRLKPVFDNGNGGGEE